MMRLSPWASVAVVLAGAFVFVPRAADVQASSPVVMVLGCAQSDIPQAIFFPASPVVYASATGGQVNGLQTQPTAVLGNSGALMLLNTLSLNADSFNLLGTAAALECGAILQDSTPGIQIVGPPARCAIVLTGDQDCDINTVDQGRVTYTLANAGGRFAINGAGAQLGGGMGLTTTLACAPTTPGVLVVPGGRVAPFSSDQCQGAVPVAGGVTPNPALLINVGFAPGVPLSSFGSLSGLAGLASGFALSASYTRDPELSAQMAITAISSQGPATVQAQPLTLGLLVPTYGLTLAASPGAIPANPTLNNGAPGVAASGNGNGALITADLYTTGAPISLVFGGGGLVTANTTKTSPGAEPGNVTFVTNAGLFGQPSAIGASAQQTISVACGVLPGINPVYNPATFSFGSYNFTSCTEVSATLYGGGAAGQATVVATFVGSITGQQAQNAVNVTFSLQSNTQALARGCDEFITPATLAANTPIATLVGTVSPSSAVVSVWQYNNATQGFGALYFSTAGAPTNGNAVSGGQSVFICVNGPASVGNGAY